MSFTHSMKNENSFHKSLIRFILSLNKAWKRIFFSKNARDECTSIDEGLCIQYGKSNWMAVQDDCSCIFGLLLFLCLFNRDWNRNWRLLNSPLVQCPFRPCFNRDKTDREGGERSGRICLVVKRCQGEIRHWESGHVKWRARSNIKRNVWTDERWNGDLVDQSIMLLLWQWLVLNQLKVQARICYSCARNHAD